MRKRIFTGTEAQYQMTEYRGDIFAWKLLGLNQTSVMYTIKRQGPRKYNGDIFNQVIFSVELSDLGFSVTSKVKDTFTDEAELCEHMLKCMKGNRYDEIYKTALFITKQRTIRYKEAFEKAELEFKETGYWPYEYRREIGKARRTYALNKRIIKSLDIEEKDLSII